MDRFNDIQAWSDALTIAQIRGIAGPLGIYNPTSARKQQQLDNLLAGIRRKFPDIALRVETFDTAFRRAVPPSRETSRQQSTRWYTGLGHYLATGELPRAAGLEVKALQQPFPLPPPPEEKKRPAEQKVGQPAARELPLPLPPEERRPFPLPPEEKPPQLAGRQLPQPLPPRQPAAGPQPLPPGPPAARGLPQPLPLPASPEQRRPRVEAEEAGILAIINASAEGAQSSIHEVPAEYNSWPPAVKNGYLQGQRLRRRLTREEALIQLSQPVEQKAIQMPLQLPPIERPGGNQQRLQNIIRGGVAGAEAKLERQPRERVIIPFFADLTARADYTAGVDRGYALGRQLTLTEADQILNREAAQRKRGVPKPYTTETFLRWLLKDPNRVKINIRGQLALIQALGYGSVPIFDSYDNFNLAPEEVKAITDTKAIVRPESATKGIVIPPAFREMIESIPSEVMASVYTYLQTIMKTGQIPDKYPEIKGFPNVTLVYDAGKDEDPSKVRGFPRLIFSNGQITWSTPPYGLSPINIPLGALITSIAGVSVEDYMIYGNITLNPIQNRALAYLLAAHPEIPIVTTPEATNPNKLSLTKLRDYIANFPAVARAMFGSATGAELSSRLSGRQFDVILRQLSPGARWRVYRYLSTHPDIYAQIRPTGSANLPYAIEDYIPDSVWAKLPTEITRYATGEPLVPNPYALMLPETVRQIAQERKTLGRLTKGNEAVELNNYDEALPQWREELLKTPQLLFEKKSLREITYYMAAHGLRELSIPASMEFYTYAINALNLADAGGIGKDIKTAVPQNRDFVNECLDADPSQAYLHLIGQAFNIPSYEILTADQVKDLFTRGYINPLPLTNEVIDRYTRWKVMTPEKQRMMATLYGIGANDVSRFVNQPKPKEKVENLILALSRDTVDRIASDLGMLVPYTADPQSRMDYVTDALLFYVPIIERTETFDLATLDKLPKREALGQMTDIEIIQRVGAYYAYRSRSELVNRGVMLLSHHTTFFIPLVRKCTNTEVVTPGVDWRTDPSAVDEEGREIFLISFGSLEQYFCYMLDELAVGFAPFAFKAGEREDQYALRLLMINKSGKAEHGQYNKLLPEQADNLHDLLFQILPSFEGEEKRYLFEQGESLIHAIEKVIAMTRGATDYDKKIYQQFARFSPSAQGAIRAYLTQLFMCGMYQRQWLGPPAPYPSKQEDTHRADFDLDIHVTPHLGQLRYLLDEVEKVDSKAATFVQGLREVNLVRGVETQVNDDKQNIGSRATAVARGAYCIREASTLMIGSAVHYMKLFYDFSFPNFKPEELGSIS